jgi:hypothetical protein
MLETYKGKAKLLRSKTISLKGYIENTGFGGRIYADPSRALYRHFGMTEGVSRGSGDEPKPSYVGGVLSTTFISIGVCGYWDIV